MVLGMASQDPRLVGVRPESKEPATQLLLDIDRVKASSLGIDLGELNQTLSVALGSAYVNDFIRDGRATRGHADRRPGARYPGKAWSTRGCAPRPARWCRCPRSPRRAG